MTMPDPIIASRDLERRRCAEIAAGLAERWEATAAKIRADGTRRFFGFGKPYVTPIAERDAKTVDAAAKGLRTVESLIRDGVSRRPDA